MAEVATLSISIARSVGGPLVLLGHDSTVSGLVVSAYREPARQQRIHYAPQSVYMPGEKPLAATWQQTMHAFDVFAQNPASETQARTWHAELLAAVTQWNFLMTVTVDGATPEVWTCDPGSVEPTGGRSLGDLAHNNPVWSVAIPCYPIPA